ncbi:MAG: hypothetical protein Q7S48_05295 [bacterium]|nr:hypothetical protein [bacterium]
MSTKLPRNLYRYFWDIEPEKLNIRQYPTYVISRLFEYGDLKAIEWIRKTYRTPTLLTALTRRGLSLKSRHFFSLLFDSKLHKTLCTTKSSRKKRALLSNFWDRRDS